jgi:hypothetical protein
LIFINFPKSILYFIGNILYLNLFFKVLQNGL